MNHQDTGVDQNLSAKQQRQVIEILSKLVAFDTQNPPKNRAESHALFSYVQSQLNGFEFTLYDAGDNSLALLAQRGKTDLLFNVHIDTVPVCDGWTDSPFTLVEQADKVTGLGVCDIKGAAAALIWAAQNSIAPLALLFSNDEEHGSSKAIRYFLTKNKTFKKAIVAEPTKAEAVLAHRGIVSTIANFNAKSGHASNQQLIKQSAIHLACQWVEKTSKLMNGLTCEFQNLQGMPFNVGVISGGIKPNMVASHCELKFGARPLPGISLDDLLQQSLADGFSKEERSRVSFETTFEGPPLPASAKETSVKTSVETLVEDSQIALDAAMVFANQLKLPVGPAVDFWTEASLFSAAGLTSVVYGPGHIEQAHTANEWVEKQQLFNVASSYLTIINITGDQVSNQSLVECESNTNIFSKANN